MSYRELEAVCVLPFITASRLRRFPLQSLKQMCESKSLDVPHSGKRGPLKADYIQALVDAGRDIGTRTPGRPEVNPKGRRGTKEVPCRRTVQCTDTKDGLILTLTPKLKLKLRKPVVTDSFHIRSHVSPAVTDRPPKRTIEESSIESPAVSPRKTKKRRDDSTEESGTTDQPPKRTIEESSTESPAASLRKTKKRRGDLTEESGTTDRPPKRTIEENSTESPAASPRKTKKRRGDPTEENGTIVVRVYMKRGDESHIAEADMKLGSDGLAVDYVAARLKLRGRLRIIHPKNFYPYEPVSAHLVSRDEIEELQDLHGNLLVTFNENYSKQQRERKNAIILGG